MRNPKMEATGSDEPVIYCIGEAPGTNEELEGEQFVGKSGDLLRPLLRAEIRKKKVRWNNTIRCHPSKNRDPEKIEIECCRPSIVRDIENTKPKVIFGFGGIPLAWAINRTGITNWRGRRIPIQVGNHTTWYYPFLHPSFVLRGKSNHYKTPNEMVFELDLRKALEEIDDLPKPIVHTPEMAKQGIDCLFGGEDHFNRAMEFFAYAKEQECIGYDYETNAVRPYKDGAKILTVALSDGDRTMSLALSHRMAKWSTSQYESLETALRDFIISPKVTKAVHNLAFEMEWTAVFYGTNTLRKGLWDDSMSQAYILDERIGGDKPGALSLDFLVLQYFGLNLKNISKLNVANLDSEPIKEVLLYNGMDAKYHKLLRDAQKKRLEQEGLMSAYKMQIRRIPTVVLTQVKGIPIDPKVNQELSDKYEKEIRVALSKVKECEDYNRFKQIVGHNYNPGSPQDAVKYLSKVLKTRMGQNNDDRKYFAKNPSKEGQERWSSDKKILKEVGTELCLRTIDYREIVKQKSTYVDSVSRTAENTNLFSDNKVHCTFTTVFTTTGRLSSRDPNMQNWPSRSEKGKEVKKQIVSAIKGEVFFSLDLGQIEARVIAMFSKDPVYCKALWENYDIHSEWTNRLALAYPDWVKEPMHEFKSDKKVFKRYRDIVKNNWTFPLFFGAQDTTVSEYLGIPLMAVKPVYKEWWKTFARSKEWQEELKDSYNELGYVETLTGRRRRAPLSQNQLLNSPIQGTTCDIVMDV
ncbi:MAG TPA: DNA polymerase, partial [Candidatus Nitrosotalea sp.]|nr:DNA polymerase [Candidatus Nitrosotalea sp.]